MLKRFGAALLAVITALAGTYVLNRLGLLRGIELLVQDKILALDHHESKDIEVVNINDSDYDNLFGGKSPLNPNMLHALISAIDSHGPAVIAVDIDTSHPQFSHFKVENSWQKKVIWERDVSANGVNSDIEFDPLDVLGGSDPSLNERSGIPVLLDDPDDKVTRSYTLCVDTRAGPKPSFVYAVTAAYRMLGTPACTGGDNRLRKTFLIQFPLRGATLVFRDAAQVLGSSSGAKDFDDFRGKIVLLGGTYRDFDRHYTPIGLLPGIAVLANAIESELQPVPVKAPSYAMLLLVEFLSGMVLFLILSRVHSTSQAFSLGLLIVVGIPLALSYALFRTPARFAIFSPTLIAVFVIEILEHLRHKSLLSAFGSREH